MGTTRTATTTDSEARRSAHSRKRFPGPLARLRSDAMYFESLKKELLGHPDFENKYVAVLRRQMVGAGPDELALFKKVTARYGDVPFYIGRIERKLRVKRIHSPRVIRRS